MDYIAGLLNAFEHLTFAVAKPVDCGTSTAESAMQPALPF